MLFRSPPVAGRPGVADLSAAVGRAVIDHKELRLGVGLRRQGGQTPLHVRIHILYRNNHADPRLLLLRHCPPLLSLFRRVKAAAAHQKAAALTYSMRIEALSLALGHRASALQLK